MATESNVAAVRRFIAGINQGDVGAVDDFVTDDVRYYNAPPGLAPGIAGYRDLMRMYLSAFPDLQMTIDDLIAEGDTVVVRLTGRGAQRGEFMGIAPTGKTISASAISIMRFREGRLAEEWEQVDALSLLQQLGALPAAATA